MASGAEGLRKITKYHIKIRKLGNVVLFTLLFFHFRSCEERACECSCLYPQAVPSGAGNTALWLPFKAWGMIIKNIPILYRNLFSEKIDQKS